MLRSLLKLGSPAPAKKPFRRDQHVISRKPTTNQRADTTNLRRARRDGGDDEPESLSLSTACASSSSETRPLHLENETNNSSKGSVKSVVTKALSVVGRGVVGAVVGSPTATRNSGTSWTREEHEEFLRGIGVRGQKKCTRIAADVKTPTSVQTKSHAQKFFRKQESSTTCYDDEDRQATSQPASRESEITSRQKRIGPAAESSSLRIVTSSEESSETTIESTDGATDHASSSSLLVRRKASDASLEKKVYFVHSSDEETGISRPKQREGATRSNVAVSSESSLAAMNIVPGRRPGGTPKATHGKKKTDKLRKRKKRRRSAAAAAHGESVLEKLPILSTSAEAPSSSPSKRRKRTIRRVVPPSLEKSEPEWDGEIICISDSEHITTTSKTRKRRPRDDGKPKGKRRRTKADTGRSPVSVSAVRSRPSQFELTYDFHTIYRLASAQIKAGLVGLALKLCHDTLLAWYRDIREVFACVKRCNGKDDASMLRFACLREKVAGMWCVYAHVVVERCLQRTRSLPDEDVSFTYAKSGAGRVLALGRACPVVGNHPWIVLALSRLQFFGIDSLLAEKSGMKERESLTAGRSESGDSARDRLSVVVEGAISICNDGIRKTSSLSDLHDLEQDTSTQSLMERDVKIGSALRNAARMVKALHSEVSPDYLFESSGKRILCFEVNRLSCLHESLHRGNVERIDGGARLNFGLGDFRFFNAIDFEPVNWSIPSNAGPAPLCARVFADVQPTNRNITAESESVPRRRALPNTKSVSASDEKIVVPLESTADDRTEPTRVLLDMEYICSGCGTEGFASESELHVHEAQCPQVGYASGDNRTSPACSVLDGVEYTCSDCQAEGFASAAELHAHEAKYVDVEPSESTYSRANAAARAVLDVEYICSGCRAGEFASESELHAHEAQCSSVGNAGPACPPRAESSTEQEQCPHKDLRSATSESQETKPFETRSRRHATEWAATSFDPEEGKGYDPMDLLDSLGYLVEYATVTKEDVKHLRRKNPPQFVDDHDEHAVDDIPCRGQVGIRCLFCRSTKGIGEEGSFVFPQSTKLLCSSMWRLCLTHLDHCKNLPLDVKQRYQEFREIVPMDDALHQQYWRSVGSSLTTDRKRGGVFWR